jgi:hypothetical protein
LDDNKFEIYRVISFIIMKYYLLKEGSKKLKYFNYNITGQKDGKDSFMSSSENRYGPILKIDLFYLIKEKRNNQRWVR